MNQPDSRYAARARNFLTKVLLLLSSALLTGSLVLAQEEREGFLSQSANKSSNVRLKGFDLPISPMSNVFYRLSHVDSGRSQGVLVYSVVPGNLTVPIDRIRFLAINAVQSELELTKSAVERLKPVSEMLERFELVDRWGEVTYGEVAVEAERKSSAQNVERLIAETAVIETSDVLSAKQWLRLEQIRLRFHCMGTAGGSEEFHLPRDIVRGTLQLTPGQELAIRKIVQSELGDLLKLRTQIDDIGRVLGADQRELMYSSFGPLLDSDTSAAMSLAHCQDDLFSLSASDSEKVEWPPILVQRVVLTPSGRIAPEDEFLERGGLSVPFPWRKIISLIESGGLEWLELSELQRVELLGLKLNEEGSIRYYGTDVYSAMMREYKPESNWTLTQLSQWKGRFREAWTKSDEKLGNRIKEILLPRQYEMLCSAVTIQRISDLGPYFVVPKLKFSGREIASNEIKKIEKLRGERLEKLKGCFERIEANVRMELTIEQRRWSEHHFGSYCPLYPSVWLFLVP